MAKTKIAAQLYNVRNFCKTPADIAVTLKKISDIGYRAVQVSGVGPIDPVEMKNIANANGLEIVVTHIGFNRFAKEMDAVIEEHLLWNCKYAGLGSFPRSIYPITAEGFAAFGQIAAGFAEKLGAAGITFVYHNHSFEFCRFGGKTGLEILLDNAPGVQSELDVCWAQKGGADPADMIRRLSGRMDLLHLKDYVMNAQDALQLCEVGEGNLNMKGILAAAAETGIKWHIVEQDNGIRDPFESLAISLKNLQAMELR